jgi:hypothetical protein
MPYNGGRRFMEKRTLQELNLLDDFLFGKMVTYPEIGERFCKQLLGTILDVKLDKIRIHFHDAI